MCVCARDERNARETCDARSVSRAPSRKDAEPLFRETLERRRAKLGDAHPDTLASANNLAALLQVQGNLDAVSGGLEDVSESLALYREALAGRRAALGDAHPHTLASLHNIYYMNHLMRELRGRILRDEI